MSHLSQRQVPALHSPLEAAEAANADEQLRGIHSAMQAYVASIAEPPAGLHIEVDRLMIPGHGTEAHLACHGVSTSAPTATMAACSRADRRYYVLPVVDRHLVKSSITALRAVLALEHPDIVVPAAALCEADGARMLLVPKAFDTQPVEPLDLRTERGAMLAALLAVGLNLCFAVDQLPVIKAYRLPPSTDTVAAAVNQVEGDDIVRARGRQGGAAKRPAAGGASEGDSLPAPVMLWDAAGLMPVAYPLMWAPPDEVRRLRLRPEFVRDYPKPLCSTALLEDCPMGSSVVHRQNVFEATLHLINEVVPRAARSLDQEATPLAGSALCDRLHSFGVNLRFLGWLLPWMKNPDAIVAVNTEIVARAYKRVPDVEEGADWSTITNIAFTRFFPPHVQVPLPRSHAGSQEFLARLHPRYGLLTDTLEITGRVDAIDGFATDPAPFLPDTPPPTPDYAQGYEYEGFLPDSVDGDALEARILELCHFSEKIMALPGLWTRFARENVAAEPSHVLTAGLVLTQDRLLSRGEAMHPLSLRMLPLLQQLQTITARLYPFDIASCSTDQSAALYAMHALDVVNTALGNTSSPLHATTASAASSPAGGGSSPFAIGAPASPSASAAGSSPHNGLLASSTPNALQSSMPATGILSRVMASASDAVITAGFNGSGGGLLPADVVLPDVPPYAPPAEVLAHFEHQAWMALAWLHRECEAIDEANDSCQKAMLASAHPLHQLSALNLLELLAADVNDSEQANAYLQRQSAIAGKTLPRGHGVLSSLHYRRTSDPFRGNNNNNPNVLQSSLTSRIGSGLSSRGGDDPFVSLGIDTTTLRLLRAGGNDDKAMSATSVGSGSPLRSAASRYIEVYCEGLKTGPELVPPAGQFPLMERVDRFLAAADGANAPDASPERAAEGGVQGPPVRHLVLLCETSANSVASEVERRLWQRDVLNQRSRRIVNAPVSIDLSVHSTVGAVNTVSADQGMAIDATLATLKSAASLRVRKSLRETPLHKAAVAPPAALMAMPLDGVEQVASFAFSPEPKSPDSDRIQPASFHRHASTIRNALSLSPGSSKAMNAPPPALRAAFPHVTDKALFDLMTNPRCVLIARGLGEGADATPGTAVRSLKEYGLHRWAGPVIVVLRSRAFQQVPPDEIASSITQGCGSVDGPAVLSAMYATKLLSTGQLDSVLRRRCARAGAQSEDTLNFFRVVLGSRVPMLLELARDPSLLAPMYDALLRLRADDTATIRLPVTAASVLDGILYTRFVSNDDANVAGAVSYACGLAGRLFDEGSYECKNPQAAEFAHMLPIRYDRRSQTVRFAHPVWRSYFFALRSWFELAIVGGDATPQDLERYLGHSSAAIQLLATPPSVGKARADARRRTKANVATTALLVASPSAAMKAVHKFKRGILARRVKEPTEHRFSGGEWLASHAVASVSDPFLFSLLAERAAACDHFAQTLWACISPAIVPQRLDLAELVVDLPPEKRAMLSANAAGILHGSGASFAGKRLAGATLPSAHLSGVCLSAADCQRADFRFSDLSSSYLSHADLLDADCKGTDFGALRQLGHSSTVSGAILCMVFVPYSGAEVVISGSERGLLQAWDCETTDVMATVRHSDSPVASIDLSPDARHIVSACGASRCTTVVVWSLRWRETIDVGPVSLSLMPVYRLIGHSDRVASVRFTAPDTVMTASFDWSIKLWSFDKDPSALSGSSLGSTTPPPRATSSTPPPMATVARKGGRGRLVPLKSSTPQPGGVSHSAGSKLNRNKAPAHSSVVQNAVSRFAADRDTVPVVRAHASFTRHRNFVTALAVCAADSIAAALSLDGELVIIKTDVSGTAVATCSTGATKGADALAFSPDGSRLAIPLPRGLRILTPRTAETERTLTFAGHGTDVSSAIVFSGDGALVAAAQESAVVMWDVASGAIVKEIRAHTARVACLSFVASGAKLLSGGWDGSIKIHAARVGGLVGASARAHPSAPETASSDADDSPRGSRPSAANRPTSLVSATATAGAEKRSAHEFAMIRLAANDRLVIAVTARGLGQVFDASTGRLLNEFCNAKHAVTAVATSATADLVALGGKKLTVASALGRVASRTTGELFRRAVTGLTFASSIPEGYPDAAVRDAAHPVLVLGVSADRAVRVWDVFAGATVLSYSAESPMWALAVGTIPDETAARHSSPQLNQRSASALDAPAPVLLLDGFLSTRNLMLHVLRPQVLPATGAPMSASSQHVCQIAGIGADVALAKQRNLVAAVDATLGAKAAAAVARHVAPYCRRVVLPNSVQDVGPLRLPAGSKEGTLNLALGGKGNAFAAVSCDRTLSVWDLPRRTQLFSAPDRHPSRITCVSFVARGHQDWVATGSRDGTLIVSTVLSNAPVVVMRPAVASPVNWFAATADGSALVTCGGGEGKAGRGLRRWALDGAACRVGNAHWFRRLKDVAFAAWLDKQGLGALAPAIRAIPLTPTDILSLETGALEKALLDQSCAPAAIAKLRVCVNDIRDEIQQRASGNALDDETITREAFAAFDTRRVVDWVSTVGLRPLAVLLDMNKATGRRLLNMPDEDFAPAFKIDLELSAKLVVDEMAIVRTRQRETFSQRSFDDVVAWSQPKHPQLQYALLCCQFSGAQLLDHTDFVFRSVISCPNCRQDLVDPATICSSTLRDHIDLEPQWDGPTRIHMQALIRVMSDNHAAALAALQRQLSRLPDAIFSSGLFWFDMPREMGHISVCRFLLPELKDSPQLVISDAKMRIYATEREPPPMVAIVDNGSACAALGGMEPHVRRLTAQVAELNLPAGWTRGSEVGVFENWEHRQFTHPTMPQTSATAGTGSVLALQVLRTEGKQALKSAADAKLPAPKPEHFFRPVMTPGGASAAMRRANESAFEASVGEQVLAAIRQRREFITIVVISSAPPRAEPVAFAAKRPRLEVVYHRTDELCKCSASADPRSTIATAVPRAGAGPKDEKKTTFGDMVASGEHRRSQGAPKIPSPTAGSKHQDALPATGETARPMLCDRFCNVESTCTGHRCIRDDPSHCRKAPFMVWQHGTVEPMSVKLADADDGEAAAEVDAAGAMQELTPRSAGIAEAARLTRPRRRVDLERAERGAAPTQDGQGAAADMIAMRARGIDAEEVRGLSVASKRLLHAVQRFEQSCEATAIADAESRNGFGSQSTSHNASRRPSVAATAATTTTLRDALTAATK